MSRFLDILALLVVGAMSPTAFGGGSHGATSAINAADFQAKVDNPLWGGKTPSVSEALTG